MLQRPRDVGVVMPARRDGLASVNLGSAKEIGLRLVADDRFENLSDARLLDRLGALGEEGMASGVDDTFDFDAFVGDARTGG